MKNVFKNCISVCLLIFSPFVFFACNQTERFDGGTKLYNAKISSWYDGTDGVKYLDTSVKINFDEMEISKIEKITFELYQDDILLGNAISQGENLVTLLKDCANYWDKSSDTYLEVTGKRVLSCAFRPREKEGDNGYWIRSKCTVSTDLIPNKLIVRVLLDKVEFETTFIAK
ncbi:MAG: hypothetical protein J6Q51_01360 [Clostridia bacterium]|nr:hypothetical protein [Clostridia bacterium]